MWYVQREFFSDVHFYSHYFLSIPKVTRSRENLSPFLQYACAKYTTSLTPNFAIQRYSGKFPRSFWPLAKVKCTRGTCLLTPCYAIQTPYYAILRHPTPSWHAAPALSSFIGRSKGPGNLAGTCWMGDADDDDWNARDNMREDKNFTGAESSWTSGWLLHLCAKRSRKW